MRRLWSQVPICQRGVEVKERMEVKLAIKAGGKRDTGSGPQDDTNEAFVMIVFFLNLREVVCLYIPPVAWLMVNSGMDRGTSVCGDTCTV